MYLNLTESSAALGMNANTETERAYWQSREKAAVKKPVEIDVHRFHDTLGLMSPINWLCSEDGECETFMLSEMYCGNVTKIYTRIGVRYFKMRDHNNLSHAKILASVKEEFGLRQK
ncbi:Uncharacterised protein [Yersinia intermedia]|uniref:hypothetical protein n=1 Tax=Yersinia intermedia TaxID=631 RepID=UPI0005E26FCF|nr:hypothetical protein [Yersinia intermedia]CND16307.1 Uncharacterised protein [Yersinia intermedia]CNH42415.1 Uncharacterised protein [Yersinia intermedia]